jgi:heme oxygenase
MPPARLESDSERALAVLRAKTHESHARLEADGALARLMRPALETRDIIGALKALAAVYGSVEPGLLAARPRILSRHAAFQPRLGLVRRDLEKLGVSRSDPSTLRQAIGFDGEAAWCGWLYVVEGSSLGGALITRRLAETAPDLPRLETFDPYGTDRGAVWRSFRSLLEHELDHETALEQAAQAANRAFALFETAALETAL